MIVFRIFAASAALATVLTAGAQQVGQPELKIDSTNRTLSVSAEERVTADPEIAILHIGFETQLTDAKSAYADGAHLKRYRSCDQASRYS